MAKDIISIEQSVIVTDLNIYIYILCIVSIAASSDKINNTHTHPQKLFIGHWKQ